MILRRFRGDGESFVEIDDAVRALTDRIVVFNANYDTRPPAGSIVYNTDFVGIHCDPTKWRGHEIWDFCQRNIALYPKDLPVTHVPIGYHPSMKRFERLPPDQRDIDVIFFGAVNDRRLKVIEGLQKAGLAVVARIAFGAARDAFYARSKLALNMLFYEDGVYPTVRAAHLVASGVPLLNETSPEIPSWVGDSVDVNWLVKAGIQMLKHPEAIDEMATVYMEKFRETPLVLP